MIKSRLSSAALLLSVACTTPGPSLHSERAPTGKHAGREAIFDEALDPAEMDAWLQTMAAEPNHVGSAHNLANAEMTLALFKQWGWQAQIESYDVLYPTPLEVSLELLGDPPYSVQLTEPAIPGDAATGTGAALPAYLGYQGDGDVTAALVYANHGMPADYEALQRMGVTVQGKIVITRYGGGWRGLKPKLAQEHGAVGCLIYSDPHDDGYATDDVYPEGPARPAAGLQRGSVMDMPIYPGDPLTPGRGATPDAVRLSRAEAVTLLKIPALPISYGAAQRLLEALGGQVAPPSFRGSLALTYHIGDDESARAHLLVRSDWSLKTIHNVVAKLPGALYPDQWVLRGNHRDGWVMGATDPLSGHIALMAEAQALGALLKTGWRPKRTLIYLSWDGEEPGLIGSTEWAETHAEELKSKALVYINSDSNGRGFLQVGGTHALQHFVREVAVDIQDPQTRVSVDQRQRAALEVEGGRAGASGDAKKLAKIANAGQDLPLAALGSGSDYSTFFQHLGIASLNVGYGGEGSSGGVYHSLYDDYAHHSRFVDPGAVYSGVLAQTIGHMVLRWANAELPPQRYVAFAEAVADYLEQVKQLSDEQREAAQIRAQLLASKAFQLAADPTQPSGAPSELLPVPPFDFKPLERAVARLTASAESYDSTLAAAGPELSSEVKAQLFAMARETEQCLSPAVGLPGRPWYKNLVYAPGLLTGYGAKTLPAVREGIEQEHFADAQRYITLTATALLAYAQELDQAVELMKE